MARQPILTTTTLNAGRGMLNDMTEELYAFSSDTISAGWAEFSAGATVEARIALADAACVSQGKSLLHIPQSMLPYDISLCPATTGVQRVHEGGNFSVYEPEAYGAKGDDSRDDQANVQACINAAATRGTVVFNKMFKCDTQVTIPSSSELTGLGWQTGLHFTWTTVTDGEVYLINTNNTSGGNTDIRLRDFTLRGAHPGGPIGTPTPSPCGGILFRLGSDVEVRNVQIEFVPAISLAHQGIDRFVAESNYVHDGGRDAITGGPILTWPSSDVRIQGNTLFNIHDDFIACNQSVDSANPGTNAPTGWSILGNVCRGGASLSANNFARGITLSGAIDCTVSGNEVRDTNQQGIYILADAVTAQRCSKIRVEGNTVRKSGTVGTDTGQGRAGVHVDGADEIQILNNTIAECAEQGILIFNATEWQIQNNALEDNGATSGTDGMGMYLNGNSTTTTDGTVSGNTVRRSESGGIYAPNCARVKIFNNDCYNNGQSGLNSTVCGGIVAEGSQAQVGNYYIHDNVCLDTQATKTQVGGINLIGATAIPYVSLYDNNVVANKTGNFFFNNTPTVFERRGNQLSTGASKGQAVLVDGTVAVSTAEVRTGDSIQLTRVVGTGTTRGVLTVGTITQGVSFVIRSEDLTGTLSADDDSTVFWEIVH